jgi:hypothetical protein
LLVTGQDAWVLTDEIEAQRLKDEELPSHLRLHINPWADVAARQTFVREATDGETVMSDACDNVKRVRPLSPLEQPIPHSLQ